MALYLGTAIVVVGLSKAHAVASGYVWSGSPRFAWSFAYIGLLCLTAYALGLPEQTRTRRAALVGRAARHRRRRVPDLDHPALRRRCAPAPVRRVRQRARPGAVVRPLLDHHPRRRRAGERTGSRHGGRVGRRARITRSRPGPGIGEAGARGRVDHARPRRSRPAFRRAGHSSMRARASAGHGARPESRRAERRRRRAAGVDAARERCAHPHALALLRAVVGQAPDRGARTRLADVRHR